MSKITSFHLSIFCYSKAVSCDLQRSEYCFPMKENPHLTVLSGCTSVGLLLCLCSVNLEAKERMTADVKLRGCSTHWVTSTHPWISSSCAVTDAVYFVSTCEFSRTIWGVPQSRNNPSYRSQKGTSGKSINNKAITQMYTITQMQSSSENAHWIKRTKKYSLLCDFAPFFIKNKAVNLKCVKTKLHQIFKSTWSLGWFNIKQNQFLLVQKASRTA